MSIRQLLSILSLPVVLSIWHGFTLVMAIRETAEEESDDVARLRFCAAHLWHPIWHQSGDNSVQRCMHANPVVISY